MARNERIKLTAAYFNNIAVGAYVGGALVPILTFMNQYFSVRLITPQPDNPKLMVLATGFALVAAFAGLMFRRKADAIIQRLED
jgi:hypothetical protein